MTVQVRVFQTTLMRAQQPPGEELVMVSCRSLDGAVQLSMQVRPDSAPLVGDLFELAVSPIVDLGPRIAVE